MWYFVIYVCLGSCVGDNWTYVDSRVQLERPGLYDQYYPTREACVMMANLWIVETAADRTVSRPAMVDCVND